ncbi:uncharacterized protein LOC109852177 isoform X2 [Pseudomyrmex gracilis]|uniref:uncharacterized protein LOC109852177 isoform X2 n=1 Tax=Pseudomyrmex gracilis TaxID=219809 RepID=UPI0009956ED8|nr:uncharacterized protein LOC109852177 isoform X2 [Pseudomyrmex gracilis]
MSESDDTDVLLLIPPDVFHVPSPPDSDASSAIHQTDRTSVISELVGHMQSLESRITAIESRDNSLDVSALNNSLDSQLRDPSCASRSCNRQNNPPVRFSVSQSASSLQNTPVKPRKSLSVPSAPAECISQNCNNSLRNDATNLGCYIGTTTATSNTVNTNSPARAKLDVLTSRSDPSVAPPASCGTGFSHAMSCRRESLSLRPSDRCTDTSNLYSKPHASLHSTVPVLSNLSNASIGHTSRSRIVQEMELLEVDELLQEMEATELELSKRINSTGGYQYRNEPVYSLTQPVVNASNQEKIGPFRKLDFQSSKESQLVDASFVSPSKKSNNIFPDISLPYGNSSYLNETEKMITEFKTWEQNAAQQPVPASNGYATESTNSIKNTTEYLSTTSSAVLDNTRSKESLPDRNVAFTKESAKLSEATPQKAGQYNNNTERLPDHSKMPQGNGNIHNRRDRTEFSKSTAHVGTNTDSHLKKCQRLLSLSDFWDINPARSQEETLRIKLEEEKFRREHCEHLIQELQKRLLEQQEKVAVAVRVDNEKNVLISQFHAAWSKLKQEVETLEIEHRNSQTNLQSATEKHQSEVSELQSQIKRLEGELSKALDLAAGYKEKSDTTIREKVDLLKNHADELESYKLLVQEAENRYEEVKIELNKLLKKNEHGEEALKIVQDELNREHLKGSEVRKEMGLIHKALDACEAELAVLRQEKDNLQLKLKEEINRNSILEQKNLSLLKSIDDAKKAEKLARDETKSIVEEKQKIREELQKVYQKQVDEVVKAKLQEFQMQLDSAESEFLEELKTRQQVIAECAAKKIKDLIDKHRLEINLLEEKHKEEKRLFDLQLAQALQRSAMLETHLNSQRATKSQLAEQLHSVMQKQWQQALQIISGTGKTRDSVAKSDQRATG